MQETLEQSPLHNHQAPLASSWLRERQGLRLATNHEEILRSVQAPSVDDQATRLLQFLAAKNPKPGSRFRVSLSDAESQAVSWATDAAHMKFLAWDYLCAARGYLTTRGEEHLNDFYDMSITPSGWHYLESIHRVNPDSDLGFIAMWFNESTRPLRDEGLRPAVRAAGYQPLVIDERPHANRIDAEIVANIRRSRLLVADIRSKRGGVYFEAGFALGLGIPVFWTCEQRVLDTHRAHFDIRQFLFTPWTGEDWPRFVKDLSSVIVAIAGRGPLPPA